ncbi:MAG: PAS domain-containing protein [Alphaproteobacteria bacterium]|nr:PAS domain-containing protein [Alphaproteobacteria bacterium]
MCDPWLSDARLASLLHYWCAKRRTREMPARADLDPIDLDGELWANLALTEIVPTDGRERRRFRLSGNAINVSAGLELTGRYVDEIAHAPSHRDHVHGLYDTARRARRPVYSDGIFPAGRGQVRRETKRLVCPLSTDGRTVDTFITAQIYNPLGLSIADDEEIPGDFKPGIVRVVDCPVAATEVG